MPQISFPLRSAFVALPLEKSVRELFADLQGRLSEYGDILRFQSPETPHLTLQFWKEVMEIEYCQIVPQCKKIADTSEPFTLKIQGAATYGSRGEDRVLYLSVPFSEELARLKKRCPWPNIEPFSPHVTLARIKHPQRFAVHKKKIMKLLSGADVSLSVDHLRLYAKVNGIVQTPLQDFPFRKYAA